MAKWFQTDKGIEQMRQDIINHKDAMKFVENTKKMFKDQGRDFNKEYQQWKEDNENGKSK